MRCEVCGRVIYGKPYRRIIEGARMIVCEHCSKLGSADWSVRKSQPTRYLNVSKTPPKHVIAKPPRKRVPVVLTEEYELVEGFHELIRTARIKLNLSHEELGRRIGEKVSVLKKVERGKMTPDYKLAKKLEHALHIRLLEPPSEEKKEKLTVTHKPVEVTIGDIIQLRTDKREGPEERRRS